MHILKSETSELGLFAAVQKKDLTFSVIHVGVKKKKMEE